MTQMTRTKRLAREIQREEGVPYMVALNKAKAAIAAEHADAEREEREEQDTLEDWAYDN